MIKSCIARLVVASIWAKVLGLMLIDLVVFPILLWMCYSLRLFDVSIYYVVPKLYLSEVWVSVLAVASLFCASYLQ